MKELISFEEGLKKSLDRFELSDLERRLRPAGTDPERNAWFDQSQAGFLGANESYVNLLRVDWETVQRLALSYSDIAKKIKEVDRSENGVVKPEKTINGHYFVLTEVCCGAQTCPWGDGAESDSYMIVGDKNNPEHLAFVEKWRQKRGVLPSKQEFDAMFTGKPVLIVSGFQGHLIEAHYFFQGKETIYRTDPTLLVKYLGIKS